MMRHYSRAARRVALALLALLAVPLSASAQWNAAASMNAARLSVRLVTLADGRVLAVGAAQDPAFAHTAEVYNPATNTWSLTGPLPVDVLDGHELVLLKDGRAMVVGGFYCCGPTNFYQGSTATQIFNPATNTWTLGAPAPRGRDTFGISLLADGRVMTTGGAEQPDHPNIDPLASADIYDPVANTWSPAAPTLYLRWAHRQVTLNDGRVMVMGGESPDFPHVSSEIYNPATNTWTFGPDMQRARREFTATKMADGRILIAGGVSWHPPSYSMDGGDTAEIYDPSTNVFTLVPTVMNQTRWNHAAVLMIDGKVLITGGQPTGGGFGESGASLYDPATNSFSNSTMAAARSLHGSTALLDGRVMVAGGWNNNALASAELFGVKQLNAAAGADQTVNGCTGCLVAVTLSGAASSASAGHTLTSYAWATGGSVFSTSASPTVSLNLGLGAHTFTLTVTQDNGLTDTDDVVVTVIDAVAAKDALIAQLQSQLATANASLSAANTQVSQLQAQVASLTAQVGSLTSTNAQLTTANQTLTTQNAQLTTANSQLTTQNNQLTAQNNQLTTANQQLTSTNQQLQGDLSAANAQITGLQSQVSSLTADNAALTTANQQLQSDLTAANQQVSSLQGQVSTLTSQNASLTTANQQLQSQVTSLTSDNQQLQNSVASLTSENSSLHAANDQLTADNVQLASSNAQLTASNAQLTASNAQLTSSNQQLQSQVSSLTVSNQQLQGQVSGLTTDNAQLTTANQQLQSQVSTLTAQNLTLSSQLAAANASLGVCQADLNGSTQALANGLTQITTEFRVTFGNPAFTIPGTGASGQFANLANAIVGLKKSDEKPIYHALGGR